MVFISICDDNRTRLEELKRVLSGFCEEKNIEYQMETVLTEESVIEFQKPGINLVTGEFHFREGHQRIELEQIVFIESYGHTLEFTVCVQSEEKKYTMLGKLSELQVLLAGNHFVRTHQSYLVNLRYIKSISNDELILQNGRILSVSRSRYPKAKEIFSEYERNAQGDT